MRPTIIPEQLIPDGHKRIVVSPPDGDLMNPDIAPVEAVVSPLGAHTAFSVRCMLEEGDIERLQAGGFVWLTFVGGRMPIFRVQVGP
jgi:hypothetical protein